MQFEAKIMIVTETQIDNQCGANGDQCENIINQNEWRTNIKNDADELMSSFHCIVYTKYEHINCATHKNCTDKFVPRKDCLCVCHK